MNSVPVPTLIDSVVTLLTEAYAGPPDPNATWFIDNEPDSGILGILSKVSAEEASTSVDGSGEEGTTIAANAEHLRWSLAQANASLRGEPFQENWKESWRLITSEPGDWDRLRAELRAEYETLCQGLKRQTGFEQDEDSLGVIALLPHAAYHLGTIRQMVERVRSQKIS